MTTYLCEVFESSLQFESGSEELVLYFANRDCPNYTQIWNMEEPSSFAKIDQDIIDFMTVAVATNPVGTDVVLGFFNNGGKLKIQSDQEHCELETTQDYIFPVSCVALRPSAFTVFGKALGTVKEKKFDLTSGQKLQAVFAKIGRYDLLLMHVQSKKKFG